jgi:hypothetical protein
MTTISTKTTTAAASTVTATGKFINMSRESMVWDQAEKGYVTDEEYGRWRLGVLTKRTSCLVWITVS